MKKWLALLPLVLFVVTLQVRTAGATPYVLEDGITGMDQYKVVRAIQGSQPWVEPAIDYALSVINSTTGSHWTHGPDVPWDGVEPIAQLQLPEGDDEAWVFTLTPAARAANPDWPGGNWSTWQVFKGTHTIGGVTRVWRSLTEVTSFDPGTSVSYTPRGLMLHELSHVAGLADNPSSGGVMSAQSPETYNVGDWQGMTLLASNGFGGGRPWPGGPAPTTTTTAPRVQQRARLIPPRVITRPTVVAPTTTVPTAPSRVAPVLAALRLLNQEHS